MFVYPPPPLLSLFKWLFHNFLSKYIASSSVTSSYIHSSFWLKSSKLTFCKNWHSRIDWIRNYKEHSIRAVSGTGLSKPLYNASIDAEKIITGHAWFPWNTYTWRVILSPIINECYHQSQHRCISKRKDSPQIWIHSGLKQHNIHWHTGRDYDNLASLKCTSNFLHPSGGCNLSLSERLCGKRETGRKQRVDM